MNKIYYNKIKNNVFESADEQNSDCIKLQLYPNLEIDDYNETTQTFETNIEKLRTYKLKELDATYNSYILSLYPIEKQMKLTMQYNALLNKQITASLTPEEQEEKANLESLHSWYKGVLVKHQTDKIYLQNETDIEKLKKYIIVVE
jgi:hypothetical protein